MLTNEILSPAADEAAARYGALIGTWQGIHGQARSRSDLGSSRGFTRAYSQAVNVADTVMATEESILEGLLDEIALQALSDVAAAIGGNDALELSEAAHEATTAIYEHLLADLRAQAARDVAFLMQSLRRHALQVHLASRARRIPLNLAVMQARIGGAGTDLDFAMRDRGGNRWPSRRYVRALVRHALLTTYNEVALLALADAGIDRAEVRHLDPKAEVHGMTIAMSPDEDLPTYAEIRDSVFHPNAEALIVAPGAA